MQLEEVNDFLCELYHAAREFIETYVIDGGNEFDDNKIHQVKSFVME